MSCRNIAINLKQHSFCGQVQQMVISVFVILGLFVFAQMEIGQFRRTDSIHPVRNDQAMYFAEMAHVTSYKRSTMCKSYAGNQYVSTSDLAQFFYPL